MPSSSRLFPVGWHVYFACIHVVLSSKSLIVTFDWLVTQRWVRGQSGGFWGWQTQLDHFQVSSMCISHVCMCIHVYYMFNTRYTPASGLVVLAILKNPYFVVLWNILEIAHMHHASSDVIGSQGIENQSHHSIHDVYLQFPLYFTTILFWPLT